jgi:hypothetical protein
MNDDADGGRGLPRMWPPPTGLLAIVAGIALMTAACGGGSSSPQVASLGQGVGSSTSSGSSTATGNSTAPGDGPSPGATSNPTQLLDQWTTCMRSHGDPGQADPTIDANKVIDIPAGAAGAQGLKGLLGSPGGQSCSSYLTAAQRELAGISGSGARLDQATLVKFAECMRANGVPNWPDPGPNGFDLSGANIEMNSPGVQNGVKVCAKQLGLSGFSDGLAGAPGSIAPSNSGPGGGSAGNGGSGANA